MKKQDLVLLGAILAVILMAFAAVFLLKQDGDHVIVRVDGREAGRYSLSQDGEYALNGGTNTLRIQGGKAFLTWANCPDHLCVKQGRIDSRGETITCLPNRLTVTVYSAEKTEVELVG